MDYQPRKLEVFGAVLHVNADEPMIKINLPLFKSDGDDIKALSVISLYVMVWVMNEKR